MKVIKQQKMEAIKNWLRLKALYILLHKNPLDCKTTRPRQKKICISIKMSLSQKKNTSSSYLHSILRTSWMDLWLNKLTCPGWKWCYESWWLTHIQFNSIWISSTNIHWETSTGIRQVILGSTLVNKMHNDE